MRTLLALAVTLLSAPLLLTLAAWEDGPPAARTGGFGEPTCEVCHYGNPLNAPGGSLDLEGVPSSYIPGRGYVITVKLARSELTKAGFEIASRFADGEEKGKQAGTWAPTDDRTQLASANDGALFYAQQTLKGAKVDPPGAAQWTLSWTAPASASKPIVFNLVGNAADDNTSPSGDFIYTMEVTSDTANKKFDVKSK